MNQFELLHGDCLELLKELPNKSADMVMMDPPYGILTGHRIETDVDIPLLMRECYRVLKPNSFLVYFGLQPTLTYWNTEAFKLFRYKKEIIWYKGQLSSMMLDMSRLFENIVVVIKGNKTFNDVKLPYTDLKVSMGDIEGVEGLIRSVSELTSILKNRKRYEEVVEYFDAIEKNQSLAQYYIAQVTAHNSDVIPEVKNTPNHLTRAKSLVLGYKPRDVVAFTPHNKQRRDMSGLGRGEYNIKHPTVKPIQLMNYLLDLTTQEGDLILDPFMGSGTTGVACRELRRRFIGMELHEEYFKIAHQRILGEAWEEEEVKESGDGVEDEQLDLFKGTRNELSY